MMNLEERLLEERKIVQELLDVEYFNLEVSPCCSALVFNASKRGIQSFLQSYAHLNEPPDRISFVKWARPSRCWLSWEVKDNEEALPSDPSPYRASLNGDTLNTVVPTLLIQYLREEHSTPILAAGGNKDGIPLLIMNQMGWKMLIEMMQCLLNRSYWFYVTPSTHPLPFKLTTPYPGNPQDHVFKAIECIRLEPEGHIYLTIFFSLELDKGEEDYFGDGSSIVTDPCSINANSAGLLLLAKWIQEFNVSGKSSEKFFNPWRKRTPEQQQDESDSYQWVYLIRVQEDSPYRVFSFQGKIGENDLYILGNSRGLDELSQIIEKYAFSTDHDEFGEPPPERRRWGEASSGVLGPEGVHSLYGWGIVGGAYFNPAYNPSAKRDGVTTSIGEQLNFVNKRVIL